MEYILFLTYRCNLNCKYCFAKNLVHNHKTNQATLNSDNTEQLCKYIENDIVKNNRTDNSIVFFGGEPSLVPEVISKIIQKTSHLKLNYSIYTNGLLLDKLPTDLLMRLQTILVAIDGDVNCHELYKPKGSYDLIIDKVKSIRDRTNAQIIARITMEEQTNIDLSVINLLKHFDFVHWQIVNKDSFEDAPKLIDNYRRNINSLFNRWKQSLRDGNILNIIPFNRIVYSIISNEKSTSFKCGCGTSIQAIDIDGNIYLCDEYIEDRSNSVANIYEQNYNAINYKKHFDLFKDCSTCEISQICSGRCRKCLETQSANQIRVYCELTKILINMILDSIDEIRNTITINKIDLNTLCSEIYNTEIVP